MHAEFNFAIAAMHAAQHTLHASLQNNYCYYDPQTNKI